MQKTVYQVPELRDANDNIIQQGAFGKNTALSNATNDGWIDYVMNNLEALHETAGDGAASLDSNGHVVEPANLAIGDEDGNRIKNSYLKLSGGKVTGIASFRTDFRMLDNQDNRWGGLYVPGTTAAEQYLSLYGGTRATGDARLNLYSVGNGKFELTGYSTDGTNTYTLTHDNSGNLNWRGYPLAWKKDYLALSGGTMNGDITFDGNRIIKNSGNERSLTITGGTNTTDGSHLLLFGTNSSATSTFDGCFILRATDGTNNISLTGKPDGSLTWGGNNIALSKDVLPLSGGTMTGGIKTGDVAILSDKTNNDGFITINGGYNLNSGAQIVLVGENYSNINTAGAVILRPRNSSGYKEFILRPNGTITWDSKQVAVAGDYLPSSGGTVTGDITLTGGKQIKSSVDTSNVRIQGGTGEGNGAKLVLHGKSSDISYAGNFELYTTDGTNSKSLFGKPDGTLTWNGKYIALSDNPQGTTLGTTYKAAWTENQSSSNGQQLTGKIENVPVGVYILEAKLPIISTDYYYMSINTIGVTFAMNNGVGRLYDQQCVAKVIKVTNATNAVWLQSAQSAVCNFSYIDRGGISLTRIG